MCNSESSCLREDCCDSVFDSLFMVYYPFVINDTCNYEFKSRPYSLDEGSTGKLSFIYPKYSTNSILLYVYQLKFHDFIFYNIKNTANSLLLFSQYPIEVLFRSIHYALLDTCCREYFFLSDFFLLSVDNSSSTSTLETSPNRTKSGVALAALFDQVMGHSLSWLQKHTETQVIPSASHDALGLLICLQLVHAMLRLAKERGVPVLEK